MTDQPNADADASSHAPASPNADADASSPAPASKPADASNPAAWRGKWVALAVVTLVSVSADQWSKHWAQTDLQHRVTRRVTLVEGYLAFSYVRNPGAAWGFLARADERFRRPFFICVSIAAMLFILHLFYKLERGQTVMLSALSLVMGGAIGNFIDRLRYDYVVDFIDFHVKQHFRWPTFNVADIAITVGVFFLFFEMFATPWLARRRQRAAAAAGPPTASADPAQGPNQDQSQGS